MDAKKMLIAVATTAVGFSVGLMVYNRFLAGAPMQQAQAPSAEETSGNESGE